MISLVIGGDVCPEGRSTPLLVNGDASQLFGELHPLLEDADLALANLEGPLVKQPDPISKIGPHHGFDQNCGKGLQAAGFRLLNLGNNHAMDHGVSGLTNTIRCCSELGIDVVGAGKDLQTAGKAWIKMINGLRIAVLSYTEHEFGLASERQPGTNPLSLMHFVRTMQAHHGEWDYLLVLVHGGNEYYQYPRPDLQDLCRFMAEQGAHAVICQHSHCVGCHEEYAGGHIVYGQGNLVCDSPGYPCEQEGILVVLRVNSPSDVAFEIVPFYQSFDRPGPQKMTGAKLQDFLTQFRDRSQAILNREFVVAEWRKFCLESPYNYLSLVHGYPKRIRELDRKFGFLRSLYTRDRMAMLLHLFRCESHREAIMGALGATLK